MGLNSPILSSKKVVVIHLDQVQMEEIVEQKLLYFLEQRPLGRNILKSFYEPAEQAIIEFILKQMKGNQLKSAQILGINRNTLKKKTRTYNLNIKELLMEEKSLFTPQSRIFLSASDSLDLLQACRARMLEAQTQNQIPEQEVLRNIAGPVEKKIIHKVLEYCKGNQIRASHFLGINRNTLKKKISLKPKIRKVV